MHQRNGSNRYQRSDLVVTENKTITTSTTVKSLTVKGNAVLTIDYTSTPENTFVVTGNVLLQDKAQLIVGVIKI